MITAGKLNIYQIACRKRLLLTTGSPCDFDTELLVEFELTSTLADM